MADRPCILSPKERARIFGAPPFSERPGGLVELDAKWVAANLVQTTLPQLRGIRCGGSPASGRVTVHRLALEPFRRVFAAIAADGFLADILTYDGLFYPRHIGSDPRRPLSSHSWGIAIDLNAAWNGYGRPPAKAGTIGSVRRLVPIFDSHGFAWGGDWNGDGDEANENPRVRDGMHWELAIV